MSSAPTDSNRSIIPLTAIEGRPDQYRLEVSNRLCAGPRGQPFLFGGSSLAAAVAALEESVGHPVAWANAQYHSYARPGDNITLTTHRGATGKRLCQVRLTGDVEGRTIFTVQATVAVSNGSVGGQWVQPQSTPSWRDCPIVHDHRVFEQGINTQFEFRLAVGRYPDGSSLTGQRGKGHVALWVRPLPGYRIDRPMLAVIADYMSLAICDALGAEVGSNSLDNTIRFHDAGTAEWVLAHLYLEGITNSVADARALLFSDRGELLASASTSLAVRSSAATSATLRDAINPVERT